MGNELKLGIKYEKEITLNEFKEIFERFSKDGKVQ